MNEILNEDHELEQLKKWWNENGTAVTTGLVIGLAVVLGWQSWQSHQRDRSAQASAYFSTMRRSIGQDQKAPAIQQAERLLNGFEDSAYAVFAALSKAKTHYQLGHSEQAIGTLEELLKGGPDPGLATIARLRLVALLLDQDRLGRAGQVLDAVPAVGAYAGERARLAGDLASAKEDRMTAIASYRKALESNLVDRLLIEMKLAELGESES